MAAVTTRPNIRIEIQNNLVEPMEVDDGEAQQETEFEDGEIEDDPKTQPVTETNTSRVWNNKDGGLSTGVDIFNDKEHEKLQDRANRFGLNPDEIRNFTNDDLQRLHNSLGISGGNENEVRFEAIHMRGTDEMSTEDVFEYFAKYLPSGVEWIDDESCNIVWRDKLSAARALHFTSNAVRGMPVDGPCDPFSLETDGECRSILLSNETRSIEIAKEPGDNDVNDNEVGIGDITAPIPPGYWRRGLDHPKSKILLLRFAFKTDRKPMRAERFSEYYKKYGNPNFGFLKGVISASCRNKFKGIFDRNKDIKASNGNGKNPWGDLAENWNQDERFSEQAYIDETLPPPPPVVLEPDSPKKAGPVKAEVLKRLGTKRARVQEADAESNEGTKKVSKVPRMRMYADEEEVKIKRKKQLMQLKQQQPDVSDLRNMIGNSKSKMDKTEVNSDNDLGSRLKNRKQKEEDKRRRLEVSRPVRDSHSEKKPRHKSPTEHERRSRHRDSASRRSHHYRNKMHSDRYERRRRHRSPSNEDLERHKPKSKVAVVIKTQKRPAVASTVWSRITPKKERLKTASERLQSRRDSSSSSESSSADSSSSSSSNSDSSDSSSDSEEESNDEEEEENKGPETTTAAATTHRPGFTNPSALVGDRKSPLRIEINNDHFKEE